MAYNGIVKKSKTYDALVAFTVMTAAQPLLMDTLTQFDFSQKWVSLTNLIFIAYMAYLRMRTTGAVGTDGPPDSVERRGQ
jgi:uncharacterized membrane protein